MTKQYEIVYTPEAIDDLKNIFYYIAYRLKSRENAAGQINRIRNSLKQLNTLPNRYAKVEWEPWLSLGIHKMPVNNYIVFYLVNERSLKVTIFRIFYGGRNIQEIVQ